MSTTRIQGKALIVMDVRSILAACAKKQFRIDYIALAQEICRRMQMDVGGTRVILVMNRKLEREHDIEEYDYGFVSSMHYEFEKIGMSLEVIVEDMYGTDVAIACTMQTYSYFCDITHLVLVSGSLSFALPLSQINQHKRDIYKIVCMFPFFLSQALRRQANAVYELGNDIPLSVIDLNRPKEEDFESGQLDLPLARAS